VEASEIRLTHFTARQRRPKVINRAQPFGTSERAAFNEVEMATGLIHEESLSQYQREIHVSPIVEAKPSDLIVPRRSVFP
jgi:hypothetical protein